MGRNKTSKATVFAWLQFRPTKTINVSYKVEASTFLPL